MNADAIHALATRHGLSEDEYARILNTLGRTPTMAEVGVLSAMWSEHCSYKSSRVHLKRLFTQGPQVIQGPGENAGVVDLGDGWAAVFKMESHNHPSFIEPYEGAATGIGGVLRDIFTMGARPVGLLNSLCFGSIDHPRTSYLVEGVVSGIAGYGNCVGVPTVGGQLCFDSCFDGNILVNVFAVGVARQDELFGGIAQGVGNPVFYVGARTGRDGIHGATMASAEFDSKAEQRRPTVQVGDPFQEKVLIEACLELMQTGHIVGIQDMGAAGLTSSSVEMAARGGCGVLIDVDKIPRRAPNMNAYECLLSESQERMLVVLKRGHEAQAHAIFQRWELECVPIGEVIDEQVLRVVEAGQQVCDLPIAMLTDDAPVYDRPQRPPASTRASDPLWEAPDDLNALLLDMLCDPNLGSRRTIHEQFDSMVGAATVLGPGQADAALLHLHDSGHTLALAVDCNNAYCALDPRAGAALALAECTRNISCTGALPLGTTDCLNFGDPTRPEIMWQLSQSIDGLSEAARVLKSPIVSGNVSLYNASSGADIDPVPMVAVVGVLPPKARWCGAGFVQHDDVVILVGRTDPDELGASAIARHMNSHQTRLPSLDLDEEAALQRFLREAIASGLLQSAHDCSEGGVAQALVECTLMATHPLGFTGEAIAPSNTTRQDLWLFAESASRVVVSVRPADVEACSMMLHQAGLEFTTLGVVSAQARISWPCVGVDLSLNDARAAHGAALDQVLLRD